MSELRSTDFRPGMRLTEIVGCVNTSLDVIASLQFKLAEFDNSRKVKELELKPLGNGVDPSMICTSFILEKNDTVSDIDVNYGNAYIGTLTATVKSGRKMTWGRRYYPLTERWSFSSTNALAGLYGSTQDQTLKYIGFIAYKFSECSQLSLRVPIQSQTSEL